MVKVRRIIVGITSIIYFTLFLMKVEMPRAIFITLLSIVLVNHAIEEWNVYKETKKKIHLLIPVASLAVIVVSLVFYVFS